MEKTKKYVSVKVKGETVPTELKQALERLNDTIIQKYDEVRLSVGADSVGVSQIYANVEYAIRKFKGENYDNYL